jgi:hypothetical protein
MSSDDGVLVRKAPDGKWIGQHYFHSSDILPDIDEKGIPRFLTMDDACAYYSDLANNTEYGFTIKFETPDASRITHVGYPPLDPQMMASAEREQTKLEFEKALTKLINQYGMEQESNTPDFILSGFLCRQLDSFNVATSLRTFWYGRDDSISKLIEPTA